jgi:pyruvate-formate lyase-activating enzyme
MRIQTFSILAGSEACNARCPFCISKMTPPLGVELKEPEVNWRNFRIACRLAERCGTTTAMFTSKGEPTIFPHQITRYLREMQPFGFPIIELQSNGILVAERPDLYAQHLTDWYELGMTTVALSVVHWLPEKNRPIYLPYKKEYIDLPGLIQILHGHQLSVRLAVIMAREHIEKPADLEGMIEFARSHRVEQLTFRPVNRPGSSREQEAFAWSMQHHLEPGQLQAIVQYLELNGTHIMTLSHGARVYDVHGQNVCLTDSLTADARSEDIRQLIFFPDGHLRDDWQYPGAILL